MKRIVIALLLALFLSGFGVVGGQEGSLAPNAGFTLQKGVVAGGGMRAMGASGFELGATAGQPAAGVVSGGANALNAGFWNACLAEAAVVPEPGIATDGVNITLSWLANTANAAHEVWVTVDPIFEPDDPGAVEPVVTQGLSYEDLGWAAHVANHFYVLRGLNPCGAASGDSSRLGEFTFGLVAGT